MFVNTLTADDKYSLLNRDNLNQLGLFQKQNFFLIFSCISKSTLNFEHFEKNDDHSIYFRNYTPKNVVRYMSKKSRFKVPLVNMVNGFKQFSHLNHSTVTIFSVILKVIESEKVCFSQMQSLISVC